MPPAAFWASQGKMDFWAVVISGTAGSYFGSIVSYCVARVAGAPLVARYGKNFLLSKNKIEMAEVWISSYGAFGVFLARLLPVVRHLISIPAGIFKMKTGRFSAATLLGAFLWCLVLSWFGREVIGGSPELLSSPEMLITVCKQKLHWFVAAALFLSFSYALVVRFKNSMLESKA
jgi:membrane protein DedA with SNARE-associated domain